MLSLLNALSAILALIFFIAICFVLNFPGVSKALATSYEKLPLRINIELNFRSMLLSFFIVSLLAKASIMNCKLRVSSGVAFFKWKSNPNNLTVVKTNLPLNRGSNSNPADTWFALKRTDLF